MNSRTYANNVYIRDQKRNVADEFYSRFSFVRYVLLDILDIAVDIISYSIILYARVLKASAPALSIKAPVQLVFRVLYFFCLWYACTQHVSLRKCDLVRTTKKVISSPYHVRSISLVYGIYL